MLVSNNEYSCMKVCFEEAQVFCWDKKWSRPYSKGYPLFEEVERKVLNIKRPEPEYD